MSSFGSPLVVSSPPVLLEALTAPLLPVPGSLVEPPVMPVMPVVPVAVASVVDPLVASLVPVLCVCPCDTPVVGGSPVVGVEAVPSVALVTVPSVALVGPTLVAVPVPSEAVTPLPASPHPNIPAVTTRASPRIRC